LQELPILIAIYDGVMYALSFEALLTLFASAIGLAVWLCLIVLRSLLRAIYSLSSTKSAAEVGLFVSPTDLDQQKTQAA
jgi:hypothetical protein